MDKICKNCKFWNKPSVHERTLGVKACGKVEMIWEVGEWKELKEGEYEDIRVIKEEFKEHKAFVNDGSDYYAVLLTKENFGCNQFEKF